MLRPHRHPITSPFSKLRLAIVISCLAGTVAADPPPEGDSRVFFWGDWIVNGIDDAGRSDFPSGTVAKLTLDGMEGGADVDAVGATSGGSLIAVGGRDTGGVNGVLQTYVPDGGAVITTLHAGDLDDDYANVGFSPDSSWVSFISDLDLNGANAVYVVPTGGGTVKRVSQAPVSTSQDVTRYVWAGDSATIFFVGDPVADGVTSIWRVDATDATPTPVEVIPGSPPDPDVGRVLAVDSAGRVYFTSDYEVDTVVRLYRVNADGTNLEQVPGTGLSNGSGDASIGTLGISPDGTSLAFSADSPDADLFQVYTMPLSGSTPTLVSNVMTTPDAAVRGPIVPEPIAWSPDATRLAVAADWDPGTGNADNANSVFVLPSSFPAGGVRVLAATEVNSDASQVEFASSQRLVVLADLVLNNDVELFVLTDLTTADQDPTSVVIVDVPAGGDVFGFVTLPTIEPIVPPPPVDSRVFFWGDWIVNGIDDAGRSDFPSGTVAKLTLDGMEGGADVDAVGATSGGSLIAVGGRDTGGVNGVLQTYVPDGGAVITTLHAGDLDDDYANVGFSPDSSWVSFISDLDLNGANAVYVVPTGGGTVKRVSQAPVSTSQDVTRYVWAGDSATIFFVGDPVADGVTSIWRVDATDATPTPVEVIPGSPPDPDVGRVLAVDSAGRVYFTSDYEVDTVVRLYRVNADGTNLEQVPGTGLSNGGGGASIGTFGISPDGTSLAFSADSPDADLFQVYTMPLSGSTPTLVSNVMTTPDATVRGPVILEPIAWSPDATHLAVAADWNPGTGNADNAYSVFVLPTSFPSGGVRVLAATEVNSDASQVEFASSQRLVVLADLVLNNDVELFVLTDLTTADQDPTSVVIVDVPAGGDVFGFVTLPTIEPIVPLPPAEPAITSITDVPNDQGRQISLVWAASGRDHPLSPTPVTEYAIFREIDPELSRLVEDRDLATDGAFGPDGVLVKPARLAPPGWHFLLTVPAFTDTSYAVVAATLADSTLTGGIYYSTFLVRAATATPSVYFDSAPDSGYSVDNLAPAIPVNLDFGAPGVLTWDPAPEEDFVYHTIYGSTTAELEGAVVIGYSVDPEFDVNATPHNYYLVTTTDFSGNEGPHASVMDPSTGTGDDPTTVPGAFALLAARPNPFRSSTVIAFDMPRAERVVVRLFDAAGRRLRTLTDGRLPAGRHAISWVRT